MARLGFRAPFRPSLLPRRRFSIPARVVLPPLEDADEFPALSISTPNARVVLPPLEDVDEFPALSISWGRHFVLPVLEDADEFPAIRVDTPILPGDAMDGSPGQLEWNGFLLGRTTPYRWIGLRGWRERPPNTAQNVPEPSSHGTLAVRPLLDQRTIQWTSRIRAPRDEIEAVVDALAQATPTLETAEEWPLVINDLGTPYLVMAQISRPGLEVVDQLLRLGHGKLVMEWICPDPRKYSLSRTGVNLPVGQTTVLLNAGNASSPPLIRIPGPAANPSLLNTALNRQLGFNLTVDEGEQLVIDPKKKTAYIGTDIVIGDRTLSSVPIPAWVLGRGANPILYTTTSGGGTDAIALYRDAWTW
ncbi:hypothetical protein [Streptosporangium sp. NPDC006930]|uniref:hypothetical protein n=1 Tax=Streptosporangium sp. NPDC006930 TaxID=3154783 RepID=UPI003445B53E